jgi:hypothetical protein
MDGQEPVAIDWDAVKEQLEMAFNEGYDLCMAEHEEAQANLMIMLSAPSGNA